MQPQRSIPTPSPLARSARHTPFLAPLTLLALALSSANAQTPSFTLLGFPQGHLRSGGFAISADGQIAVGSSVGPEAAVRSTPGFVWSRESGRYDFGLDVGITRSQAWGVSGDGSVVVGGGQNTTPANSHAFRWSQAGGYQDLGTLPGFAQSVAVDANHDGSIVVGTLFNAAGGPRQGFRWSASGGMQALGVGTDLRAVSGDGRSIIGNFGTAPDGFVWTESGGQQFLPAPGGSGHVRVGGINFDGTIIVGQSMTDGRPLMWMNGVVTELASATPDIPTLGSIGVSDDGRVVVGQGQDTSGNLFAAVWTPATGIIRFSDYLAANGVAVPSGLTLSSCSGVSADGRSFVGSALTASDNQAFVATIPSPTTAATLTLAGLIASRRSRNPRPRSISSNIS